MPSLTWLVDVITYWSAATAPEVSARTPTTAAAPAAIIFFFLFKVVPSSSQAGQRKQASAACGLDVGRCCRRSLPRR